MDVSAQLNRAPLLKEYMEIKDITLMVWPLTHAFDTLVTELQ